MKTLARWDRFSVRLGLAAFAVLAILALHVGRAGAQGRAGGQQGAAGGQQGRGGAPARNSLDEVLVGTIDVHTHQGPDNRARSLDAVDVARLDKMMGMRGLVLKSHLDPTADRAYFVRKEVPGIEAFGLIDLNLNVGGMNPDAVEHFVQVVGPTLPDGSTAGPFGRVVMMGSDDADYQVKFSKLTKKSVIVARNGELVPEAKEIIGLIKKYNLTMTTGHHSGDDALLLIKEAIKQGIPPTRIGVTHANIDPPGLTLAQMQEAAKLGVFVEVCGQSQRAANADAQKALDARNDRMADIIKKVGPASIIMETDLGQAGNEYAPIGFAAFIRAMRARGITAAETDLMTKRNPARYLGIPELPSAAGTQ
jgi:hypothetical protein